MTDLVEILVDRFFENTDIMAQDDDGCTALMFACKKGCMKIVNILLANGSKINVENKSKRNALMVALEFGQHHIAETLMERQIQLDEQPKFDRINTDMLMPLVF